MKVEMKKVQLICDLFRLCILIGSDIFNNCRVFSSDQESASSPLSFLTPFCTDTSQCFKSPVRLLYAKNKKDFKRGIQKKEPCDLNAAFYVNLVEPVYPCVGRITQTTQQHKSINQGW